MVCARVPFLALGGPGPSVFGLTLSIRPSVSSEDLLKRASLPALCCSRSTSVSHSAPEEERQRPEDGASRAPSPLVHGRISSDESEAEGPEEHYEFSSSAAHPRPVVVSRRFPGNSIFTSDNKNTRLVERGGIKGFSR